MEDLSEVKEAALKSLGRLTTATWEEYGVDQSLLQKEIDTWYWKPVWKEKAKGGYVLVATTRGTGQTFSGNINLKIDKILAASSQQELELALGKAKQSVHMTALYLWSTGEATGPASSIRLMSQAAKAESLSRYLEREGNLAGAAQQKDRARLLKQIAKSDDPFMPVKPKGIIDRLREEYAKVDINGVLAPRASYIAAGIKIGVHPGTCAVQYARWKKEKA